MPQELYHLNSFVLTPSQQGVVFEILLWIALAVCVGTTAWFVSRIRIPPTLSGVALVGVLASTLGSFLWTWLLQIDPATFNPFSLAGSLASVVVGVAMLWAWRLAQRIRTKTSPPSITL